MKNNLVGFILLIGITFLFSCKEEVPIIIPIETSSVTDASGNIYKTVKIGAQWWMAENLQTSKYRNGNSIELLANSEAWETGSAGYCIYDNSILAPGFLYNWEAVKNENGLAPQGWHVATEEEWKNLERFLKMPETEINKISWRNEGLVGDKLKTKGPNNWLRYENVWGNNESGFDAVSGGCRLNNGEWGLPGLGATGFWWTDTEFDYNNGWMRQLDSKKSGVFRYYISKKYGLSVRCIKD